MLQEYPKKLTLKNRKTVVVRPLDHRDSAELHAFFMGLPEEDRLFLRHDVRDPELMRQWAEGIDPSRVIPLIAEDSGKIIADGTLHMTEYGWTRHIGGIRLVIARTHRHLGLGGLMTRELVELAEKRGLEKLQAHVVEEDIGAVKMFEAVGFKMAAVLEGMIKDQTGKKRNLAIMVSDVSDLSQILEDWIQESMVPAYRAPTDPEM